MVVRQSVAAESWKQAVRMVLTGEMAARENGGILRQALPIGQESGGVFLAIVARTSVVSQKRLDNGVTHVIPAQAGMTYCIGITITLH